MDEAEKLSWWDGSQPRRIAVFSFGVAVVLAFVVVYPDIDAFLEKHKWWQNLLAALPLAIGAVLAYFELRHSGEANEHRAQTNRLMERANEFRDEANHLSEENIKLQRDTFELHAEIHQLQESIEKKLTKVRLYARARLPEDGLKLLVSNLSEFDLWLNQVELIVTEAENGKIGSEFLGGGTRISRGHTEDGYHLYGTLVRFNGDRTDRLDMKFYVKVVVTGVEDNPVTVHSPKYQLILMQGKTRELKVLEY